MQENNLLVLWDFHPGKGEINSLLFIGKAREEIFLKKTSGSKIEVLKDLLLYLEERQPGFLRTYIKSQADPNRTKRKFISEDESEISQPIKIAEHVWVETNFGKALHSFFSEPCRLAGATWRKKSSELGEDADAVLSRYRNVLQ